MTRRSESPLALIVRIKSWRNISNTEERVILITAPAMAAPITNAGKIIISRFLIGFSNKLTYATGGLYENTSEKTNIIIVANAKFGIETPSNEKIRIPKTVLVLRFEAAIIPNGMEIIHEIKAANIVSSKVNLNRFKISGNTSLPV